jgi:hypothetical protein
MDQYGTSLPFLLRPFVSLACCLLFVCLLVVAQLFCLLKSLPDINGVQYRAEQARKPRARESNERASRSEEGD